MKVFISSTHKDLVDHRAKVAEAVERLGQQGVRMVVFGARPSEATEASLDEVDVSEVFVGIYAHRYGYVPLGSQSSITRMEFDHARKLGKPILCFVVDDDHPWIFALSVVEDLFRSLAIRLGGFILYGLEALKLGFGLFESAQAGLLLSVGVDVALDNKPLLFPTVGVPIFRLSAQSLEDGETLADLRLL